LRHPTAQSGARGIIVKHDLWHGVSLFYLGQRFFFEKKNQKTFAPWDHARVTGTGSRSKSFFATFFSKKVDS
jgi:hypothetical protein